MPERVVIWTYFWLDGIRVEHTGAVWIYMEHIVVPFNTRWNIIRLIKIQQNKDKSIIKIYNFPCKVKFAKIKVISW